MALVTNSLLRAVGQGRTTEYWARLDTLAVWFSRPILDMLTVLLLDLMSIYRNGLGEKN